MILDLENRFSDKQDVTTGSDTGINSTNVIDLGIAGRNIGIGKQLWMVALVTTAFTDSGSNSNLRVDLVTDDNASLSSPTVLQKLGVFPVTAPAGSIIAQPIGSFSNVERYICARYTVDNGNGALSAGNVSCFLTDNIDAFTAYANNYKITN